MNLKLRRTTLIVLLFVTITLITSCINTKKDERYVIGFSQCMMNDVWRQAMIVEMNIEASNYENIDIIVKDAKEDNQKQIEQIKELIQKKVDVLIISPNESDLITPIAVQAYRSGIPTIIVDRKINSDEYTSYIGGDSYQIGKMAGEYASSLLNSGATILEVWGTHTTSPAQERHNGFIDGLNKDKNFQFITVEGKWRRDIARIETNKIKDYSNIELIYAHNDVMALGARDAIIEIDSNLVSNIKILGVDGAFGKDAGLEAVSDGRINASFLYPTGGDKVINVAMKIINNEPINKRYILNTALIDETTATTLLMQSNQLINYQKRIEQQRQNINNLLDRFSILRNSLTTILILMVILITFALYIYYINQKIRKRNNQLKLKNIETEKQKKQLIVLNDQIKEVTDQKVRFFMNVSHEIKTPLTLIISPLEKWIKNTPDSQLLTDLLRMKKNTDRLTRVINQLLDFRKIESSKVKLNISKKDIVEFTATVKLLFDGLAESKNIHYTFSSNKLSTYIWFDTDKIEKVLVNLLSNAFKFTQKNGNISIFVHCEEKIVSISVKDDGCGISKENLPFIFDRFFTDNTWNSSGTGIGLHLTKEFVELHGGTIFADSILGVGTTLEFKIPIDANYASTFPAIAGQNEILSSDLFTTETETSKKHLEKKYDYTILIAEDDSEIRDYLSEELSKNFRIYTAKNGAEAYNFLTQNFYVTLVLSDVLMPEMNGFELCTAIKSSPELSDIPVILLTALSEIDQRIYGIAEGADDYIQKPFNINYLKIKIIRLLEERRRLQKKLMHTIQTGGVPENLNSEEIPDSDKVFLNKFILILESSYSESDISIEKLSETIGISRVHLYRKIKDITGLTPVDYLRNFRLAKAVELLGQHRHTISEIAYQTGFSSPAYFSKCFRDVFNMTPSEYSEKGQ